jgi:hypothetical protein
MKCAHSHSLINTQGVEPAMRGTVYVKFLGLYAKDAPHESWTPDVTAIANFSGKEGGLLDIDRKDLK